MNANQILSKKGYDLAEQNDIINFKTKFSEDGLDMKVRKEFMLSHTDQPIHLWDAYYPGDADEKVLQAISEFWSCDVDQLLARMDSRLLELVNEIPDKE